MYRTGPAAALILGLSLALAACGGGGSSSTGTGGATTAPAGEGTVVRSQPPEKTGAAKPPTSAAGGGAPKSGAGACQARIGEFVSRMDDLRQALLSGLDYSEYVLRVKAIRDAYEAVPVDKLGVGCLAGAATDAEDAFNQYLRAANLWGECAGTAGCAASSIEGRLQHRWHIASESLEEAKRS